MQQNRTKETNSGLTDFYEKEIESCRRAFEDTLKADKTDNLGAIADALYYCQEDNRPLPSWIYPSLFKIIKYYANGKGEQIKRGGRSWLKQYMQDMIDYESVSRRAKLTHFGV